MAPVNEMKKKISYLIPGWTIDSHIKILTEYAKAYDLTVFIVLDYKSDKYKYSIDWIKQFASDNQIDIRIYRKPRRIRDPRNFFFLLKMFRELKALGNDIVYTESGDDLYSAILSILFLKKRRTIQGIHNVIFHPNYANFLWQLPRIMVFRWFKYFRIYSIEQKKAFLEKYKYDRIYVSRIPEWKNTFDASRPRIKNDPVVFLFAGNIHHYKGVDLLISAANKLSEKYKNFKVIIAGSSANWKEYDDMILDRDLFELDISFVEEAKMLAYFNRADFLVLPYRHVTQSGIITLGYSANLPAIVSDCPGFREYVTNKENGLIFDNADSDSLCAALEYALLLDQPEYQRMTARLKAFTAKELALESIASENTAFFDGLIKLNES
jgi:glycosyltransferase involved in cell wall biosynthesis